jgi:hypothetical protein
VIELARRLEDPAALAHKVLDDMIADVKRPECRTGIGAYLVAMLMMQRAGMRFLPAYMISWFLVRPAAERMHVVVRDMHAASLIQLDHRPVQLLFCNRAGCPGCEPGAECEDASGAPSEV